MVFIKVEKSPLETALTNRLVLNLPYFYTVKNDNIVLILYPIISLTKAIDPLEGDLTSFTLRVSNARQFHSSAGGIQGYLRCQLVNNLLCITSKLLNYN